MESTNQPNRLTNIQAPPSLHTKLETRLQGYRTYLSTIRSAQEAIEALQDAQWEIRSAAVEMLGSHDSQVALGPLIEALHDSNNFVRISAICTLGKVDAEVSIEQLPPCLQDEDWQVREMAVLILGELRRPELAPILKAAQSDSNSNVRTAADSALQLLERDKPEHQPISLSPEPLIPVVNSIKKEEAKEMEEIAAQANQQSFENHEQHATILPSLVVSLRTRRRWPWSTHMSLFIAATVVILIALTAASFGYGWWNKNFGDPNTYQTIQQQQTDQGVTIVVTKAYADEGRTVIAYDTYAANHDQSRQFFPNNYNIQGSVPEKQEPLGGTFGDFLTDGVTHFYMVLPAFEVSVQTNTVTITWDIQQMIVVQPGTDASLPMLSGHWHFTFTVPFHHEDNRQLPDPIHGKVLPAK